LDHARHILPQSPLFMPDLGAAAWNQSAAELYKIAVKSGEGRISDSGSLVVSTGNHTGRSPNDKFIVRDDTTAQTIWWDNNKAMSPAQFATLAQDFRDHARVLGLHVQDLHAGADPAHRLNVRVVCEKAWHALFIRHLLIRPDASDVTEFAPDLTIIDLPSFKADPDRHGTRSQTVIAINLAQGLVLIGGTHYAGEMKKAVFTVLNYLLPAKGVMPMHCSANAGADGRSTIFFGLSGTGKTTLSADPKRQLIGDDEHGWSQRGIYNFEGGCYAKVIRLSPEAEPQIFAASNRLETVLENVVMDETGRVDFNDGSLTENTRAAYPIEAIANAKLDGVAAVPSTIIMLTADAFGVLPPIAKLSPSEAMYHFLSGYTAKVAGTERGVSEPEATFSACFGAPFIPRHPSVYGNLLRDLIARNAVSCFLVNTGWTGGAYGVGKRMPIAVTRALIDAALSGSLDRAGMRRDPHFGFAVPVSVPSIDPAILDPRSTWSDAQAYDAQAKKLASMFVKNFARFEAHVSDDVRASAPALSLAA
jgi:phosphoenolpyruvate carboxykinase (ATP)